MQTAPLVSPWYIAGIIVVALLALYVPKIAGGAVILIAVVLGITAAKKGLLNG